MPSLSHLPLFDALASARSVLIAGAGGGFDVYAGLPLALALARPDRRVHLANLSFSALGSSDARWLGPAVAEITAETRGNDGYFPERSLARWLAERGTPAPVYAFDNTGVQPVRDGYRVLRDLLGLDAIVLVDGGTDILMRGDEAGLGTPEEDMVSLAAVAGLDGVATRLVVCIGFGVDAFHGVCHAHFLENAAALERDGGYLGTFSLPRRSPEGEAYLDAVAHSRSESPRRPSIVNGSIAAALRGEFGDAQFTDRTNGSELFVNPLMSMYWAFDLAAVAARSLYLPLLEDTQDLFHVRVRIERFREGVEHRARRVIPH